MPNCNNCKSLETRRKIGWRNYYKIKESFVELSASLHQAGINNNQKRIITNMYFNQESSFRECSICLNTTIRTKKIVLTKCGHIYDKDCIDNVIGNNCPLCRQDMGNRIQLN